MFPFQTLEPFYGARAKVEMNIECEEDGSLVFRLPPRPEALQKDETRLSEVRAAIDAWRAGRSKAETLSRSSAEVEAAASEIKRREHEEGQVLRAERDANAARASAASEALEGARLKDTVLARKVWAVARATERDRAYFVAHTEDLADFRAHVDAAARELYAMLEVLEGHRSSAAWAFTPSTTTGAPTYIEREVLAAGVPVPLPEPQPAA